MTINCNGKLIDLKTPKVMGILNYTNDSFFDGGKYISESNIIEQISILLSQGADIIDVGFYSSRPNATFVSVEEELERASFMMEIIKKNFPDTIFSIDTFRSEVAELCLKNGASMINDISAGSLDDKMMAIVGKYKVPYIMMHTKGTPQDMTQLTQYNDLITDIVKYFSEKIALAKSFGINDIIIDVGFGFAKTLEQNYELMSRLEVFKIFELPNLVGISRKSMIYKALNISPQEALNGTTVLNTIALTKGANILRVHDVKEAKEAIELMDRIKKIG